MKQIFKFIVGSAIIAATIIPFASKAQITTDATDTLFNDFRLTLNEKAAASITETSNFICSVYKRDTKTIFNKKTFELKRQLNDSVFIIAVNKQNAPSDFYRKFQWIFKANNLWKLSPGLLLQLKSNGITFPLSTLVSTNNTTFNYKQLWADSTLKKTPLGNIFTATIANYQQFYKIVNNDLVMYMANLSAYPKEELQINDLDLSVNKINLLHSDFPLLNGDNITISIKENLPDTADIDFGARYVYNPLAATSYSSHATIMATMIAGAGNSYYLGKGVAGGATITASNFTNLLPDADNNYRQFHISVQNHSYGVGIENFYGADAAAYDAATLQNDSLLFVFSAGNAGNLSATTGKYAGIINQANITGSFKMAKNIITVGAVDSFGLVANASSRGPAFDGRVAPTLVAYGEDGTSGAAALVSGLAAVLQQAYKTLHSNQLPSGALLKAVLINSADKVGGSQINYTSGYGNINAVKAINTILSASFIEGSVTNNEVKTVQINIPANTSRATFTLVWNDPPAQANAYIALVNDLDLSVQFSSTNQVWLPWVLNSFTNKDSLSALPLRKRDSLNTIEQITITDPDAGNYKLLINGFNVTTGNQKFYVVYQFDTTNKFQWNFPASTDNIFPGGANVIRWESNLKPDSCKLFYSINNGISWQLIDNSININKNYYYWNAPDTNAGAILKMQIGVQIFLSEPFTITSKLNLKVGFNCPDSVLFYWNKLPGISGYTIFDLQGKYLLTAAKVTDTSFVFNKQNITSRQFAVAPIVNGLTGVKSYTTNYTQQGVECYVSDFLGDFKNDTTAMLQLQLGSNFLIKKIIIEKLNNGIFTALKIFDAVEALHYTALDNFLQNGENTYRAHLILQNGKDIFSYSTSIYYFKNSIVSIYPNPIFQHNYLTVQLKDLDNQSITITNVLGQVVYDKQAVGNTEKILANFLKGLYVITVINKEKANKQYFKILIL